MPLQGGDARWRERESEAKSELGMKVVEAAFSYIGQAEFWEGSATFDDGETCGFTARRDGTVRMNTSFKRRGIPEGGVRIWRSATRERAIREYFEIPEPSDGK